MNAKKTSLTLALGAAFATSAGLASVANAADNPFAMQKLDSGYQLAAKHMPAADTDDKKKDGKCGEGKCGGDNKKSKADDKKAKADDKKKDGKCGEGKCGGDNKKSKADDKKAKADDKKKDGKCGEGKCGGSKP